MKSMNIYLCGVGGQGIGLLSEVMIRTAMDAGYYVMGADTHGLAQRGGTVVSHLRIGKQVFTPLVPAGEADIILALERLEALRAMAKMLKPGGNLIYYNTAYQSISVREGNETYPTPEKVAEIGSKMEAQITSVCYADLPDPRMQNVALVGQVVSKPLPVQILA